MASPRRICSKPRCKNTPTPDGRYCKTCFAAANRASHERHRKERNARRRTRADYRDDKARANDSARAKVFVAIARGTLTKKPCVVCGGYADLTAYIADPACWREVVWVCRDHRADEIARRTTPPPVDPAIVWQTERERALAAIAALPEAQQAALRAIAARGPAGMVIAPEAPFFTASSAKASQLASGGVSSRGSLPAKYITHHARCSSCERKTGSTGSDHHLIPGCPSDSARDSRIC